MQNHGYYWDGVLTNPVFLIKPMNSNGELAINNAPACQADFPGTIAELVGGNDNQKYGTSVFDVEEGAEREQLFYQYYLGEAVYGKECLIEYQILGDNNRRDNFALTDVEYTVDGKKIKHSDYCKVCKGIEEVVEEGCPPRLVHYKDTNYPD